MAMQGFARPAATGPGDDAGGLLLAPSVIIFERRVSQVHRAGEHALGHLFRTLADRLGREAAEIIEEELARFASIPPELIELANPGGRFAPRPLTLVTDLA
jgi:hypothetical protein